MAIYIGCDGRDCPMQIASVEQFKRSVFRAFDGAARHYCHSRNIAIGREPRQGRRGSLGSAGSR